MVTLGRGDLNPQKNQAAVKKKQKSLSHARRYSRRTCIGRTRRRQHRSTPGVVSSLDTHPPSSLSPSLSPSLSQPHTSILSPSSNTEQQITTTPVSYKNVRNHKEEEEVRNAIHMIYKYAHHAYHHTDKDLKCIVSTIFNNLGCKVCPRVISRVCQQSKITLDKKETFDPTRKSFSLPDRIKIKSNTVEEHLVTVLKEKMSYANATHLYNILIAKQDGSDRVSLKALYNAVQRTTHEKNTTVKVSQASDDREFWKKARLIYCLQYLIRLGEDIAEETIDALDIDNKMNMNYHILKSESLTIDSIYQIAFWDEVHFQQVVGESCDQYISFPRDDFGVYDPTEEGNKGKERVSKIVSVITLI